MVLWQSDLRVSWRSQWMSLLLHGLVAAFVLLMPWPLSYTPLWLLLLSFVVFDSVRWQGKEWDILGMPWMLNCGMMLRLRKVDGGRCQHLWLAADSMDAAEWRDLRRMLLQQTTQG